MGKDTVTNQRWMIDEWNAGRAVFVKPEMLVRLRDKVKELETQVALGQTGLAIEREQSHRREVSDFMIGQSHLKEIVLLKKKLKALEEYKKDNDENFYRVIADKRPHDELHCSCVVELRRHIDALAAQNRRYGEALKTLYAGPEGLLTTGNSEMIDAAIAEAKIRYCECGKELDSKNNQEMISGMCERCLGDAQ